MQLRKHEQYVYKNESSVDKKSIETANETESNQTAQNSKFSSDCITSNSAELIRHGC